VRISDLEAHVRNTVNDTSAVTTAQRWTTADVVRELSLWQKDLFRQKIEADPTYNVVDFDVLANSSRITQLYAEEWLYALPSWVYRINDAYELVDGSALTTKARGNRLAHNFHNAVQKGWRFKTDRAVIVQKYAPAPALRFEVRKVPCSLFRATTKLGTTTTIVFDVATAAPYQVDLEDGAMLGAQVEITTKVGANDSRGVVATVIGQSRAGSDITLTIAPPLPAASLAGETFEMHAELSDAHLRYLILLTAETLLHRHHNAGSVFSLQPQIKAESARFVDGLQPRREGVASEMPIGETFGQRDPDRDPLGSLL
jgi:hypothetical protein